MNAITGLTYLLQKTNLSQDQHAHLNSIQRSATSLIRIINDIPDFSKVVAGKLDIEESAYAPEEILGAIIDQVNVKLTKKG